VTATPRRVQRLLRRWREGIVGALVLSWAFMLWRLWTEMWRFPSAELLERRRPVRPPTMESLGFEATLSAVELAVLCLIVWPGWRRYYAARLLAAGTLATGWFLVTTPLVITSIQRVHRQWLILVAALLLAAGLAALTLAALRRVAGALARTDRLPAGPAPPRAPPADQPPAPPAPPTDPDTA
jgi:hypothetical protein